MKNVPVKSLSFACVCILVALQIVQFVQPAFLVNSRTLTALKSISFVCSICLIAFFLMTLYQAAKRHQWGETMKKWACILNKPLWKQTRVSVEQLKMLQQDVRRLGLALYGLTSEAEQARRKHFMQLGKPLPPLVIPAHFAHLATEFSGLVNLLNHYGFPDVKCVRLQIGDLAYIQRWGSDLEHRVCQTQQQFLEEKHKVKEAISHSLQAYEAIGNTHSRARGDAGYQRIGGALKCLEHMAEKNDGSFELLLSSVTRLNNDMNLLLIRFKQSAA